MEVEDGLWIGNQLKARNDLQRVSTISGVDVSGEQLNFNLLKSRWLPGVTRPAVVVLGLTLSRTTGRLKSILFKQMDWIVILFVQNIAVINF